MHYLLTSLIPTNPLLVRTQVPIDTCEGGQPFFFFFETNFYFSPNKSNPFFIKNFPFLLPNLDEKGEPNVSILHWWEVKYQ